MINPALAVARRRRWGLSGFRWSDVRIFHRIVAGYALVLLVMVVTGLLVFRQVQSIRGDFTDISNVEIPALQEIDDLRIQVATQQVALVRFVVSRSYAAFGDEALIAPYYAAGQQINHDLSAVEGRLDHPQVRALLSTLSDQLQARGVDEKILIAEVRAGRPIDVANAINLQVGGVSYTADALAIALRQELANEIVSANTAANQTLVVIGATFLLAGLLTAVAGVVIARSISRPLARLTLAADRIASDETVDLPDTKRDDEIGVLSRAFAGMVRTLQQQTLELKRSNGELEQFAYVASHDLQEPLRMVSSYTSLIKKRYQGKLDADGDEFIGFAVDGATRMQGLINDLLTYSRAGREPQPSEPTDAGVALDTALANLRRAIEEKRAVVVRGPLPSVMANRLQLAQLFQNLIGNAIKFCKDRRPEIRVGAERQGAEWVFCVRDNGIGLDPKYADRIFLIFQRLHKREEYPGTGIGLAICKKIVERHGGRIWVESKPGEGAAFYFTFKAEGGQQLAA